MLHVQLYINKISTIIIIRALSARCITWHDVIYEPIIFKLDQLSRKNRDGIYRRCVN